MTTWGLSPLPILAELDTQLIIAEMQGYAPYEHEMKSRIIGLMAAIRKLRRHFGSKGIAQSATGGDPSRLARLS